MSIQCPLGATTDCFRTADSTPVDVPANGSYQLLPGVLHAYRVSPADLGHYVVPGKHRKHDDDDEDDDDEDGD